jgi:hypothetical protein
MSQNIDGLLREWEFQPGSIQARLIDVDGRDVLQMRIELGILQLETTGRPDGTRPHGCTTYFEYLRRQDALLRKAGSRLSLNEAQAQEADREFVQFYHRRICWLALRQFDRAVADADHTLAFMDFVREHAADEEYVQAHEQYRGFVIFQRTQAAAGVASAQDDPEKAIDEVGSGLERMREFFAAHDLEQQMEENAMVQQLRKLADSLRRAHGIDATLREQLERAVANEEYENAAELRDALRRKH